MLTEYNNLTAYDKKLAVMSYLECEESHMDSIHFLDYDIMVSSWKESKPVPTKSQLLDAFDNSASLIVSRNVNARVCSIFPTISTRIKNHKNSNRIR